jgi:hypothetical protein
VEYCGIVFCDSANAVQGKSIFITESYTPRVAEIEVTKFYLMCAAECNNECRSSITF